MIKDGASKAKLAKQIPQNETSSLLTCKTLSGDEYVISHNTERKRFTLWHKIENGYVKCNSADVPSELEKLIPWDK